MGGRRSATVFRQDTGELVGNLIEPEANDSKDLHLIVSPDLVDVIVTHSAFEKNG